MAPDEFNLQQELHDSQTPMTDEELRSAARKAAAVMKALAQPGAVEAEMAARGVTREEAEAALVDSALDSACGIKAVPMADEPYMPTKNWQQLAAEYPEKRGLQTLARWEAEGHLPSSIENPAPDGAAPVQSSETSRSTPRTFVSYASPYQLHRGSVSIGDLSLGDQDELIKAILGKESDFQELVIERNVLRSQANGLWSLIVAIGCKLEDAGWIKSFDERDENDVRTIIAAFDGTELCDRLVDAYSTSPGRLTYDWKELETVDLNEVLDGMDEVSAEDVRDVLDEFLAPSIASAAPEVANMPTNLLHRPGMVTDLSFASFVDGYRAGKLSFSIDRGMATVAGQAGVLTSPWPIVYTALFAIGLLVFIPAGVFLGIWYGIITVAIAIICKILARRALYKHVVALALTNPEAYRFFVDKAVIRVAHR